MDNNLGPSSPLPPFVPQIPVQSLPKDQELEFNPDKHNLKTYIIEFIQTLAVCLVVGIIIYWQIAQPHKVSGLSMFPTFHNNDYIITNKIGYKFNLPKRGDVIVLTNPRDLSEAFIKRVIGLPGDRVKVQEGHTYINGEKLIENYLAPTISTPPGAFLTEGSEVEIPEGSYIVMGDNRTASSDSREWGFVPKQDIIGQVFLRYWPKESVGFIPGDVQY